MPKKLLTVFGVTGNQGGSVANYVLDDRELSQQYSVRGITRSASNPKAQALESRGASIIEADLDKPSTLVHALDGTHALFFLTNTQPGAQSREIELRQAKSLLDEALKQRVKHVIFSSLPNASEISNGKLRNVHHFDSKADIEQQIRNLPIKSSFFAPAAFMQNFLGTQMAPQPSPANDGSFILGNLCDVGNKLPLIDITDTGKWVGAVLADPDKYAGKRFAAAERCYTWDEMARILSSVTGKTVVHQKVPDDVFKSFIPEVMRDQAFEMWALCRDYGYYGANTEDEVDWAAKQARGKLTSLEEFLKKADFKLD
ncbi:hypothetical protein F66182_3060 [Fusarium sp. NRRL 66182]|nr:hypothetical protein F66182_3060 [Fusarium sp. NRRL 66182]